ncbi:MAG: cell division ATP-binding protein FtsE [Acidobacteriota bacterium]
MIRCFHVTKRYGGIVALRDVTFQVAAGEFIFLTGKSGAGKTTLLRLLYLAELPTSGQLVVSGRNLASMPHRQVPRFRRKLGLVFQDFKLIEDRTVLENASLVGRVIGLSHPESRRRAEELLRLVGVDERAHLHPAQLSGGEQQRVAIARALMTAPTLVLADEPTGNLDPDRAIEIMRIFRTINRRGTTVIVATHDPDLIAALGYRTLIVEDGMMRTLTPARPVA